ncbi:MULTISPECIES: helix-turn-helix domain-containing protein [unclassified Enterococcus]|uniref:helix-turn-helix domain-containing protein n=1 Tax=unclassified Enterococcus TaxID=2608891 RepID=UPI001A9C1006|nr:helix-turn-helix transcriptional regulator [Enterococcus sp. DIV1271a]MBO1299606.1 helix-turn-helix transcriptional regulator [Enterococcus sp. DIV1271a]
MEKKSSDRDLNLGSVLNEIRKEKKISTKVIFNAGITRPTYYRFVRGDNDLTVTNFFKIISILGLELSEFQGLSPIFTEGYKALEKNLAQATSRLDYKEIERIKNEALDLFRKTDVLGYQYVYWQGMVTLTHLRNEKSLLLDIAKQIRDYLNSIDLWTNVELKLFAAIAETLDFEEYDYFFKNFLKRRENKLEEIDFVVLDLLYLGYFETALDSKNIKHLEEALAFIAARKTNRYNYRFRVWKIFIRVTRTYLNKDYLQAIEEYNELRRIVELIFFEEHIVEFELKTLENLWVKVNAIPTKLLD